ncbi:MAG: AMP-binding protein, partial [bacterium]|nr:AMP-binding protein [bacterium]
AYQGEDKIYIYFTSGSTGKPKAIIGKNISLLHFIQWEIDTLAIDETFNVSQLIAPGFDAFLRDLFVPLLTGGRLCIPFDPDTKLNARELVQWFERSRVTLLHCVPALFRQIEPNYANIKCFRYLRYVLLSGEKINVSDLTVWFDDSTPLKDSVKILNLYGPTETTMTKTWHVIESEDLQRPRIPVGKPMRGVGIMVLDDNMNICAPLVTGNIYIRTPYSTCGYYNDAHLTEELFIPNPFGKTPDDVIYNTGDRGRFLPDGLLDLMGRTDRQVKVRGVRIQLEGIESVFKQHPLITDAVVLKKESDTLNQWLCAYISAGENPDPEAPSIIETMQEYLEEMLPVYMVPTQIVAMDVIPRTATGKVDYEALAAFEAEKESYTPPTTQVEQRIHDLWAALFKKEKISVTDSFFSLGGNSLNVITLIARIRKEFDVLIPLADIFNNPTIREQALLIRPETPTDKYAAIEPVEKQEYYSLSSAQKRLYILQQKELTSTVYNMPRMLELAEEPDKQHLEKSFLQLIQRHENLRTSFHVLAGEQVQKIHPRVEFKIEYYDAMDGDSSPSEADIANGFIRPFDLSRAPLLRIGLMKTAHGKTILMTDIHHIMSDDASQALLENDFAALYAGKELEELRLQYKDYCQWQQRLSLDGRLRQQEEFWIKELAGDLTPTVVPADYQRPPVQSFDGDAVNVSIGTDETRKLNQLAKEEGATMYMVLLAVYNVLLSKLSGGDHIIVGTGVAGRRHADLEKIIGMFVNTLPLRNYPGGDKTFIEFLRELKERTLKAFDNQDYLFEDLVEKVVVTPQPDRNPLFDTVFLLQNAAPPATDASTSPGGA